MPAPIYYTADMVRALPADGNRYETVHGELLVTPAPLPWHQEPVSRLHFAQHMHGRAEVEDSPPYPRHCPLLPRP